MSYLLWWLLKLKGFSKRLFLNLGIPLQHHTEGFCNRRTHPTFDHTSNEVVKRLIDNHEDLSSEDIYKKLLELSAEEFFSEYSDKSNLEVPLLTNDGIVIPLEGLEKALSNSRSC